MYREYLFSRATLRLTSLAVMAMFTLCQYADAAPVALSTAPLTNATTTSVLPNLMFILDNSGSMDSDYLPDWVPNSYCKGTSSTTTGARSDCSPSEGVQPPYRVADYNRIYYDPEVTYGVPWDARLATPANMTSYPGTSSTKKDGYNIQDTNSITLTTSYPDLEYCTDSNYTDCLRNDNYLLPGVVNGKSYTTRHSTTASGSKSFATGTVAAPTTTTRTAGPHYYVMVPGEYCSDFDQTTCVAATASNTSYPYAAKLRWCNSVDLTSCKLVKDSTFIYARYPTVITAVETTPTQSSGTITVGSMPRSVSISSRTRPTCFIPSSGASSCSAGTAEDCTAQANGAKSVITSIKLVSASHPTPGVEILTESFTYCDSSSTASTRNSNLAANIAASIGNGFTVTRKNAVLTVTASDGSYNTASLNESLTSATLTEGIFGGSLGSAPVAVPGSFMRVDITSGTYGNIVVGTTTIVDRSQRTDCAAKPDCTYAEELSNFANWYAWYRTRMQMMKTSASRAFKTIDNKFRVGFISINSATATSNYLKVDTFNSGDGNQKDKWYTKLFAANPSGYTPLRGALSRVGRIFAGKNPLSVTGGDDPMQYSCQQNFVLLTTDGYWNTSAETTSYKDNNVTGDTVGNMDGGSVARPMFEGPTESSGSLADVAKYYYDTDLRTTALNNCTGSPVASASTGLDVCENNVFVSGTDRNVQQHMTTFTLGLGVDGLLGYQADYKTATAGDFYLLKNGLTKTVGGVTTAVNWPDPQIASTETEVPERIDDLWHAAVNGQGVYFSAKNPTELVSGLNEALSAIGSKVGSGAAAATSTLNPVVGNNFAYVASYTTVNWTGNLEARTTNLTTGVVSEAATWCVENTVAGTCSAPDTLVPSTADSSTVYNCVKSSVASAANCSGVYDGTALTCSTEIPIACNGRMAVAGVVGPNADTRTIYTKGSSGALVPFIYANLNAAHFTATGLSQWTIMTEDQKTAAAGDNLVNFLRGQTGFEIRDSNAVANRLYRVRTAVLGDTVESQPAHIAAPTFKYTDAGYSSFKTAQADRAGTLYIGANDGMLHAFNAATGDERWAYVPSMVIPNMWKLADKNYATLHNYYVNGSPVISDIYTGGAWKTILVGGLNGGGRGYYALDITDPAAPVLLWEFDTTSDSNLGYSFAKPVVTKKADGTWVVLITSGYNNTSPGDGGGYLYVLNAATGAKISTFPTGVTGSSGIGQISTWADDGEVNNTAKYTYGGDLNGNLWRFDINKSPTATGAVMKLAELQDDSNNPQPITTRPELGIINNVHVVFVGTGKYLETSDLTDTQLQTVYAIKDPDGYPTDSPTVTFVNPRASDKMVKSTLESVDGSTRKATTTIKDSSGAYVPGEVNWSTGRGWYADLPVSGERQHVNVLLAMGLLIVPTTVPSNTVCAPGGTGWLNYFDYKTGKAHVNSDGYLVGVKVNAPIVGINLIYLPTGKVVASVVTATSPTPEVIPGLGFDSLTGAFMRKRVIWRELIP